MDAKKHITYEKFCKEYWPLQWDKPEEKTAIENTMTPAMWQKLIDSKTTKTNVLKADADIAGILNNKI